MVKIIADTTYSITVEEALDLEIYLLPQIVIFGDESYKDDMEIDTLLFLDWLKKSPILPQTASPYPSIYDPIF